MTGGVCSQIAESFKGFLLPGSFASSGQVGAAGFGCCLGCAVGAMVVAGTACFAMLLAGLAAALLRVLVRLLFGVKELWRGDC